MKVKDLFKKLALRAGIAESEAKLSTLIDALPDLDVDDELVANPLSNNLITETEAENRPKIKGKFKAEALNGIDALVDPVLAEIFDAADLETFKTENKETTKKIAKLVAKAKELKASGKPADQSELAKTVEKLNNEIAQLKTDKDEAVNTVRSEYEQKLYFNGLANKVLGRNDVTDYAKAKEGRRVITDLQETIEAAGGVLDIKTGKVMKKEDPSLILYIDNKPVTVDTMLEKTLKDNDYIKKSDGPAPAGPVQVPTQQPAGGGVSAAAAKMAAALKDE